MIKESVMRRTIPKKADSPRIWLRIDKDHVAKVLKARRDLCIGEKVWELYI